MAATRLALGTPYMPDADCVLERKEHAVRAKESALGDARKQRKETDDSLQAMMNRIAYLAQEEARIDRDIANMRKRAAEALNRQCDKDDEIANTAKEILATIPALPTSKPLRPHTGRSTLANILAAKSPGASMEREPSSTSAVNASARPPLPTRSDSQGNPQQQQPQQEHQPQQQSASAPGSAPGADTTAAPLASSRGRSASAQRSSRPPSAPRAPGSSAVSRQGSTAGASASASGTAGASKVPLPHSGGTTLRRASSSSPTPATSTSKRAEAASDAAAAAPSSSKSSSGVAGAGSASGGNATGAGTPPLRRHPSSTSRSTSLSSSSQAASTTAPGAGASSPAAARTTAAGKAADDAGKTKTGATAASSSSPAGHSGKRLNPDVGSSETAERATTSTEAGMHVLSQGSNGDALQQRHHQHGQQQSFGGVNVMSVISGPGLGRGDDDDDGISEDLHAACSSGRGGSGNVNGGGPLADGLQQFVSSGGAEGRRVVQVKATTSRKDGGAVAVTAAGVGWGLSKAAVAPTGLSASESKQLAAEVQKKKQIWKIRKTFGLEPTPLSDSTAHVQETGAGAWK